MTDLEASRAVSDETLLQAAAGFTEAELLWAIQSPSHINELIDARLAEVRLVLKRYI